MLLISSFDLISLYLAIELQSLCLYVLAAAKKDSTFNGIWIKIFYFGFFFVRFITFGISIIYGTTGTTNFENLSLLFAGSNEVFVNLESSIIIGLVFISAAFFFKIAAAPLHMWPDVYEGAPVSSQSFLQ